MKRSIYPGLWFDGKAKEAAEMYCRAFPDSHITGENPFVTTFESSGNKFMCLNGGPAFRPNPSLSFYVVCETSAEFERAWKVLSDGGQVLMAADQYEWSEWYGWVSDRYGVSWQLAVGNLADVGQKFSPVLLFTKEAAGRAEEAIEFYTEIFKRSVVTGILKYKAGENDREGFVKHAQFSLDGFVMMAMDSSISHDFNFDQGVSLVVECDTQEEIDYFWEQFGREGTENRCGWIRDKFGVWWQVVPSILGKLMSDPEKAAEVSQRFMKMTKFEIAGLVGT